MVAGLGFLSKKSFNPKNLANQKSVWEARQQAKLEEQRLKERQVQLQREQEEEELARARYGTTGGEKASLQFMYNFQPETKDEKKVDEETSDGGPATGADLTQRQPGDDDAAAAFRAMLAGVAGGDSSSNAQENDNYAFSNNSGAALQGSTVDRSFSEQDTRSALEKAVGQRNGPSNAASSLSLQEQIARFPQLKNAPMTKGMRKTDVAVSFKPLGTQLRNVQCMVCGVWGHSRGDRECAKSGWDPFSAPVGGGSARAPAVGLPGENGTDGALSKGGGRNDSLPPPNTAKREDAERRHRKRRDREGDEHSSDSSSSSSSSYERRRRKRKKERKRRRKEERRERRRQQRERRRASSPDSEDESDTDKREKSRSNRKRKEKKRKRYDSDDSYDSSY